MSHPLSSTSRTYGTVSSPVHPRVLYRIHRHQRLKVFLVLLTCVMVLVLGSRLSSESLYSTKGSSSATTSHLSGVAHNGAEIKTETYSLGTDLWQEILKQLEPRIQHRTLETQLEWTLKFQEQPIQPLMYVSKEKAATPPVITLNKNTDERLYSFILIDLDAPAPTQPIHAPYLHCIMSNLGPMSASPLTIMEYVPISPKEGIHRYIGLMFEQEREFDPSEKLNPNVERAQFSIAEFAQEKDLNLAAMMQFYSEARNQLRTSDSP